MPEVHSRERVRDRLSVTRVGKGIVSASPPSRSLGDAGVGVAGAPSVGAFFFTTEDRELPHLKKF